jgi:hypothetical protein
LHARALVALALLGAAAVLFEALGVASAFLGGKRAAGLRLVGRRVELGARGRRREAQEAGRRAAQEEEREAGP